MQHGTEVVHFKLPREVRVRIFGVEPDTYFYFFDQFIEPTTGLDGVEESWRYMPRAYRYDLLDTYAFMGEGDQQFARVQGLLRAVFAAEGVEKEMIHVGLNFFAIKRIAGASMATMHSAVIQAVAEVLYQHYYVSYDVDFTEHWHHLQPFPIAIDPIRPA